MEEKEEAPPGASGVDRVDLGREGDRHPTRPDEPAPEPRAPDEANEPDDLSPTRYGDWVHKGIAVDF